VERFLINIVSFVFFVHGSAECLMVLLDGLVVAVIAIFKELLMTTMLVELSRCSKMHDPFDITEYLF
jgi:hypothetical protein